MANFLELNSFSGNRVHIVEYPPPSAVGQIDSSDVPTASLSLAWTTVCPFSEQESSRHRKATTPLGWAVVMCAGSRLAASRRRVDGFSATTFVNWASRCSMAGSSMYRKAVSLSFELYVLGAAHHCQKWNASSFPPWHFEHWALPRISYTRISVRGEIWFCRYPADRER